MPRSSDHNFFRHSATCKYSGAEFSRRCNCRKHFRWTLNGTQYRRKAGTGSWEEAEEIKRQLQDVLAGHLPEARRGVAYAPSRMP
jgi:integrase/recombinase XerD